jgi:hypothetical protein
MQRDIVASRAIGTFRIMQIVCTLILTLTAHATMWTFLGTSDVQRTLRA